MVGERSVQRILNGLEENNLIVKDDDGNNRLDLNQFNSSVSNASLNLGKIIPSIIDVSKEQVAVINHGLENVIAFSRVFQTVNTSFAIMVQTEKVDEDFKKNSDFEEYLVTDVLKTLNGLDIMLNATFKEIDVYYGALSKIINSEDRTNYVANFTRRALPKSLTDIFDGISAVRTKAINTEIKFSGGLGIIQIINSLDELTKEFRDVKINNETVKEMYIKTKDLKEIKINIDVLQALKSVGKGLMNSLKRVGQLTEDEGDSTNNIKKVLVEENQLVSQGIKEIKKFQKLINDRKSLNSVFEDLLKNIEYVKNLTVTQAGSELNIFKKKTELSKKEEELKKQHDKIIKRQMEILHNVINLFSSIVSVWTWQVNEEIHIGQVADKTVIALKKLSKLQKDVTSDTKTLLIAENTQLEISKTCNVAKDLTSVGKVMQMLLKRVKKTIQMNSMIENELVQMDKKQNKYEEYKNIRIERILGLLTKKFPSIENEARKNIQKFSNELSKLSNRENINENNKILQNIEEGYKKIREEISSLKNNLELNIKNLNLKNFNDLNSSLTKEMKIVDNTIDNFIKNNESLKKTLSDDFKSFMNIADSYRKFVKVLTPMLDLLKYTVNVNTELTREKIGMRGLNIKLRMFQNLHTKLRSNQIEENKQDKEVLKVLKEVGMDKSIYKKYRQRFDETYGKLYTKLQSYTANYFKEAKLTDEVYNKLNKELSHFNVDFKKYNNNLKETQIGFFQKLFKTQSYKKSKFWNELKGIINELGKIDKNFSKIKNATINQNSDVKTFCSNSVILVNGMLNSYKNVMKSIEEVILTMSFVSTEINNLIEEGYLKTFKKMIEDFEKLNLKTKNIENDSMNLDEIVSFPINQIKYSFELLPSFLEMVNSLKNQKVDMKRLVNNISSDSDGIKHSFLKYYAVYLLKAIKGDVKKLDNNVKKVLKKNGIISISGNIFIVNGYNSK